MSMAQLTRAWPDLAGRLEVTASGRIHVLPLRVYFDPAKGLQFDVVDADNKPVPPAQLGEAAET